MVVECEAAQAMNSAPMPFAVLLRCPRQTPDSRGFRTE